jgi:hypothetical protein
MSDNRVVVREVSWRNLCPWLVIFRTFRLAISLPVLLLATTGTLLVPAGWRISEALFVDADAHQHDAVFRSVVENNRTWPGQRGGGVVRPPNQGRFPLSVEQTLRSGPGIVEPIFFEFVGPVRRLLDAPLTLTQAAYFSFGFLWMLVVWGFLGGAITRLAGVYLGREERIGLVEAVRHAGRRFFSYVASPLFPLFGFVLMAIPIVLAGLLMRLDVGVLIAGILWVFMLACGLIMAIFLLGLLFGWPLMWGTVSCEEHGDVFEAFSRSYSYTFQRPLHYLFYALLATLFGALGWLLVYHFSEEVIRLTEWSASLGAGTDRWMELTRAFGSGGAEDSIQWGGTMIGVWTAGVRTVATASAYGLFWCLATALYLLMRLSVDRTEFDEVYVEHESRFFRLDKLPTEQGSDSDAAKQQADSQAADATDNP